MTSLALFRRTLGIVTYNGRRWFSKIREEDKSLPKYTGLMPLEGKSVIEKLIEIKEKKSKKTQYEESNVYQHYQEMREKNESSQGHDDSKRQKKSSDYFRVKKTTFQSKEGVGCITKWHSPKSKPFIKR
ncbi:hypothetical protein RFI_17105, partial [Reticulomyxa filosa]